MKKIFASAMLASLLLASNSFGAEIKTEKWDNGYNIITIDGDIVSGDGDKFRNIATNISGPVVPVIIISNGGMVTDALMIGETIKTMGYSTYVPKDSPCNSACGLIWIAGVKRFVDPETKIGFHGAYNSTTHEAARVGNALIGSYFSRLNLSDAAIEYATMASPTNLNYITAANANAYGIKVFLMQEFKPHEEQRKQVLCYENGVCSVAYGEAAKLQEPDTYTTGKFCFYLAGCKNIRIIH